MNISKIDISLLAVFGYILINRYIIQPEYGFSIRFIELLGLIFLYTVLCCLPITIYGWILFAVLISGTAQAVYGNLQLLGYYPSLHSGFNISGSFFNPGPYAGFLAVVWSVALGMYLFKNDMLESVIPCKNKEAWLYKVYITLFNYLPLISLASIMIVLPATRSRAAWMAVLIISTILLIYKYQPLKKIGKWKIGKKIGILFILSFLVSFSLYAIYHFKKGSADGRVLIWKVTTKMIEDNPAFGVGFDRFKAHYMDAQADYFYQKGETDEALVADNSYYAFNEVLQFIAENGIFGFLLMLVLVVLLLKMPMDSKFQHLKIFCLGVLGAVLTFGLFSYPAQILPIKMVWVLALALLVKLDQKTYSPIGHTESSFLYRKKGLHFKGCMLVVGTILMWQLNSNINTLEKGFKGWKTAMDIYKYGLYEDSAQEFEKIEPILGRQGDFLMNYGKTLVMAKRPKQAVEILNHSKHYLNTTIIETALGDAHKSSGNYKEAEIAYKSAANMIPNRFYPEYLLAKLYEASGQQKKAFLKAREVLQKKIKIPSKAIQEMKREMKKLIDKSPSV